MKARPLGLWPAGKPQTPEGKRKRSPFKRTAGAAMRMVELEIERIKGRDAVLECDATDRNFNRDGSLRADARLNGPGVIVRYTDRQGNSIALPCDTFTKWEANIYAIALTLEKLRAIDRYGVTKAGEQYAGFRALPAEGQTGQEPVLHTVEDAASYLSPFSTIYSMADIMRSRETARTVYRKARAVTHPDAGQGHASAKFHAVGAAGVLLARHFGVASL
jgi:hypothetical protein